jgi:hypothetical protein
MHNTAAEARQTYTAAEAWLNRHNSPAQQQRPGAAPAYWEVMQVLVLQVMPSSQLAPLVQQGRPLKPQARVLVAENVAVAAAPLAKLLPVMVFAMERGLKLAARQERHNV